MRDDYDKVLSKPHWSCLYTIASVIWVIFMTGFTAMMMFSGALWSDAGNSLLVAAVGVAMLGAAPKVLAWVIDGFFK